MNDEENKAQPAQSGRIDKLNEGLYSPNAPEVNKIFSRGINDEEPTPINNSKGGWKPIEQPSRMNKLFGWTQKEQPIFRKILWLALGFFILCFALATYLYIHGVNTVSADKIDIELTAPLSVSASNPFALDVTVTNRNNSNLNSVDILVDYPDGSRAIDDNTKPVIEDLISVGSITKGELVKKRSEAILFGQEGEKKNISIILHYKVPGSTSVFEKKTNYIVTISSAPVTVSVDSVKELNSNQSINFDIKVTSNSSSLLKNIAIQPTLPYGFTLTGSDPTFTATTTLNAPRMWIIAELSPAESKEFKFSGILKGLKDEEKYFKFDVGNVDPSNPIRILTQYVTVDRLISIKLPFISTDIAFGSNNNETIVSAGESVPGTISFQNNLGTDINDLELTLKINDNNLIDRSHISVSNGFYSSLDNTIVWNKQTRTDFATVHPGAQGVVNFNLPFINPSISALNSGSLKNLSAMFDLTIKAKRLSDANVPEEIVLLDSSSVKIGTVTAIKPVATYSTGPFKNTGGIPPRVNNPTSYTITWDITDTLNDVLNSTVTAQLPQYVTFGDLVSPSNENVTFDKNTNIVKWNVGTVYGGQGFKTSAREVSFKVILTPSANQVGTVPNIVNLIHFEGTDAFTGSKVSNDAPSLTTELRSDPNFQYGQDKVSP